MIINVQNEFENSKRFGLFRATVSCCGIERAGATARCRVSPFFCCSSSCVCGNSTSNVIMREPRMLLLSKFGRPSPFFHIRAPGLVILSLTIWTCYAKAQQLNMNMNYQSFFIEILENHTGCVITHNSCSVRESK